MKQVTHSDTRPVLSSRTMSQVNSKFIVLPSIDITPHYLFILVHQKVVKDITQKTYEAMVLHQNHQLGTVLIVHNLHFTEED